MATSSLPGAGPISGTSGQPTPPSGGADWPAQAATFIADTVGKIRDATTTRALIAARAVVFGLIVIVGGIMLVVLAAILAVRFVDVWVPGDVWSAHLIVGSVFLMMGLVLWRFRHARTTEV
jgi:hypothetical protein